MVFVFGSSLVDCVGRRRAKWRASSKAKNCKKKNKD
jgi:hypothetical protein